jgi:hypothetical protein
MVEAQEGAKEGCLVVLGATGGIGSLLLKPAHLTSQYEEWFLAPEQSWVTGQILGVDGGLGSVRARGGG